MKYPVLYAAFILLFFTERSFSQTQTYFPISSVKSSEKPGFIVSGDIFGTRSFIENKGQFQLSSITRDSILFVYEHAGEKIYFTNKGLIYEFVKTYPLSERELEELEEGKKIKIKDPLYYYVFMNWQGFSGDSMVINGEEKQSNYFTYGTQELNAYAYKKITYKNVYPNIDIEYNIPTDKSCGIEYAFILHPGADPANIKILYSGDVKKISQNKLQEIQIKTPLETILEHVPTSFFEGGESIASDFKLDGDTIKFELFTSLPIKQTIIIDPWVTSVVALPGNNFAYDVDYDFAGNVFIYGGSSTPKVAKYNTSGGLIWSFSGNVSIISWSSLGIGTYVGNFVVDRFTGKCYIGQGVNNTTTGSRIVRLDANGVYDNFITSPNQYNQEVWDMGFHCSTGDIFVLGGGHTSNTSTGIINGTSQNIVLSTFQPTNTAFVHDIISHAIDDNGNMFVYYCSTTNLPLDNHICSVNSTFNGNNWTQPSTFGVLGEAANKGNYLFSSIGPSGGYNCLAVNNNFVFYYDGLHLAAYSKSTGSLLGFTLTALNPKQQGGIAVDACNRIYVGGNGSILSYSFTGSTFLSLPGIPLNVSSYTKYVYDLRLNENTQTLFCCGSGFVGTFTVPSSSACTTTTGICSSSQVGLSIQSSSINCAAQGSATVSMSGGTGPFTYTWLPSGQTGSVVTGLTAGTYTILVIDQGSNVSYSTTTSFTTSGSIAGTLITSPAFLCNGFTSGSVSIVNITGATSGIKYVWYSNTNWTLTTLSSSLSGLPAGSYIVNVLDTISGCSFTKYFNFFLTIPITMSVSVSNYKACTGSPIVLIAYGNGGSPYTAGSGYQYNWSNGMNSQVNIINQLQPGSYIYSITVTDSQGCSKSNTVNLTFNATPTLNLSNVAICPLHTGTLNVSGANTYTWYNNSNGNSITATPSVTTSYSVIGAQNGCIASAQASIIVNQNPIISLSNNSPICEGDTLKLHGEGGLLYHWQGPLGFSSNNQNAFIPASHISNAGLYQLIVTAVNGCTAASSDFFLIKPSPVISVHGATVCLGEGISITSNSLSGANYNWTGPANFTSVMQNPFITPAVFANAGNYQLIIQSTQGCTNSAVANVTVSSAPSLSFSISNNGTICAQAFNGSHNMLSITPLGALSYTLLSAPNITFAPGANTASLVGIIPPLLNAVETVTLIGSNGICNSSMVINFSVVINPTVNISNPSPSICAGESFTFHLNGASTYQWNTSTAGLSDYSASLSIAHPLATSVYSVVGSQNGCFSPTQTCTLTVKPLPQAILSPAQPSICIGNDLMLKAFSSATSYTWSPDSAISNLHGSLVNVHPKHTQTYFLAMEMNQCFNSTSITVIVLPRPKALAVAVNTVVCLNEPVQLLGFGSENYVWECPDHTFIHSQNISTMAGNLVKSGFYTLTVSDQLGCSDTTCIRININDLPQGLLELSPNVACVPFCTTFNLANKTSAGTRLIDWTFNQITYNTSTFSFCFASAGNSLVTCRLIDTLTLCKNTMSFVVSAYDRPFADFNFSPEKPTEDLDEVIFTNHSRGDDQASYTWFFANNNGEYTLEQKINHVFHDQGTYAIAMIVTDMHGCSDTAIKALTVIPDDAIYVPNVFTPNGDKVNDVFKAVATGIKNYKLEVYDRWGENIVESSDITSGWDGTYKGMDCAVGVYVWKIYAVAVNGKTKNLSGHVTLAR